jgi:hypothetical protein
MIYTKFLCANLGFETFVKDKSQPKFFTLKDRIDNSPLLQRPFKFQAYSCLLQVGCRGRAVEEKGGAGCIYIVLKHGNKGLYFWVPMPIW